MHDMRRLSLVVWTAERRERRRSDGEPAEEELQAEKSLHLHTRL